ncbi:hypothetical protein [Paenibacillus wynnii]|uniref:hypothetical protein n=1 Tax=Paenibacillus wynnii TaxID=268407 RepID=UPI00278DA9D9|nr:hypothetical protein [Paenibacillus wynnii]MDQ0193939.1 hypothetical protein [Paenibacillus wynnii]
MSVFKSSQAEEATHSEINRSKDKELNSMADGYNKTEADIAYERYNKMGSVTSDEEIDSDVGLNNLNVMERDEVLESDAIEFAMAAGLTGNAIDYAEEDLEGLDEEEDIPLEDVPDADDIESDTPVDPAAPPQVIVHSTDLLNGSQGE